MRSEREIFRPKVRLAYSKIASERRLLAAHGEQGIAGADVITSAGAPHEIAKKGITRREFSKRLFRKRPNFSRFGGQPVCTPDDIRENGTTSLP